MSGRKIVLAASNSESSEYMRDIWRQMVLATLPMKYARYIHGNLHLENEIHSDGQARYVPNGLRVVEALLLQHLDSSEIAVCYPEQLSQFIGDETRVVGIHAHNPMGITFATDVYAQFFGRMAETVNAAEFRRLIEEPALRRHKPHLRIIVGGPGSWQIEKAGMLDAWGIDCVVDGEAEEIVVDLFERAVRGETLPRRVNGHSPRMGSIPQIRHRSTFGVVEVTRGCGRGCQFCSIALRRGQSLPLDHILENVRRQVAEGADTILLTTEDIFLYEQGPQFATNVPALKRLFRSVGEVPGVKHIVMSHGTIAPVVANPEVVEELSPWAVGMSATRNPASTHPDHRYTMMFVGLETGSRRLFDEYMKGKSYPYRSEQWPEVVLKGMEILNRHNWFPMCTWIIGLPGETRDDTKESLDLLYALKGAKWCPVPTLFVPLEDTRLERKGARGAQLVELTDLQWEFFFTCWRYNLDFFRNIATEQLKFQIGVPLYYYFLGRRLFGPQIRYPLFRLGHVPERFLRKHLYLDFCNNPPPRLRAPEVIEIPSHRVRPAMP